MDSGSVCTVFSEFSTREKKRQGIKIQHPYFCSVFYLIELSEFTHPGEVGFPVIIMRQQLSPWMLGQNTHTTHTTTHTHKHTFVHAYCTHKEHQIFPHLFDHFESLSGQKSASVS